jgi:hypothetical protein
MVSLPTWYRSPDSWYNRSKSKILLLGVIAAIAICLLATRQDIIESSRPFIDNPLDAIQRLGVYITIGILFVFAIRLFMKLIDRARLGNDFEGPPF